MENNLKPKLKLTLQVFRRDRRRLMLSLQIACSMQQCSPLNFNFQDNTLNSHQAYWIDSSFLAGDEEPKNGDDNTR
jgi:hypothetical protein